MDCRVKVHIDAGSEMVHPLPLDDCDALKTSLFNLTIRLFKATRNWRPTKTDLSILLCLSSASLSLSKHRRIR